MSDIVERLRASVTQCRAVDRSELLAEAASEIERLRGDAEIARLRLEAAHAEVARLRLTDAEEPSAASAGSLAYRMRKTTRNGGLRI